MGLIGHRGMLVSVAAIALLGSLALTMASAVGKRSPYAGLRPERPIVSVGAEQVKGIVREYCVATTERGRRETGAYVSCGCGAPPQRPPKQRLRVREGETIGLAFRDNPLSHDAPLRAGARYVRLRNHRDGPPKPLGSAMKMTRDDATGWHVVASPVPVRANAMRFRVAFSGDETDLLQGEMTFFVGIGPDRRHRHRPHRP